MDDSPGKHFLLKFDVTGISFNHRIVDGREAVQFLVYIKQLLEDPAWMLVEG